MRLALKSLVFDTKHVSAANSSLTLQVTLSNLDQMYAITVLGCLE